MTILGIRKCLVFSIIYSWRSIRRHPFVAALLLFMLFLYIYFPSIFAFIVYSSPVIACTALLLGALLVYGEPDIHEPEDVKSEDVSVKVAEKDERSRGSDVLKKGERYISEDNVKNRRGMSVTKDSPSKSMHDDGDGDGKDSIDLAASSSSKIAEKEIRTEKTVTNQVEARDTIEEEVFSIQNPADCALRISEGLKVEIEKPSDNQFDSSLGSPWQQINSRDVSSDSESDESDESEGEESLSPDTSITDIVPIIDELHPLLEYENPQPAHRSIDTSDAASRDSSPEREFDDGSAEEETENQADEEDEAQEEKDNNEAVVKWTADDQKNLMDLGSSELERNQRLENLIAKRRAKKLQRFQTDKNLIDLDTEPLPFMDEISRLNVQVPSISAPRSNPFDMPFDSEESLCLPPIPGSAPSVLLPRRNPFDLPYDQNEESSKLTGESSRPYDMSISLRDALPRRIDSLNLGAVSGDVNQEKNEPKLKPYFVPEKMSGTSFASFESQLSEESDSEESSASESDSTSAVFNQDHELSKHETQERVSSVNQDVESVEHESDSSVEVGSANLEQEHNGEDAVEEEIGEVESSSPVSSTANLEVIDERYGGSSSSTCSEEDDKCIETSIHIEPINSAHTVGDSLRSFGPMPSVVDPGLPDGAEVTHDSQVAKPLLSGEGVDGVDDSQVADPVYDSSPSAKSASHSPSLEALFSKVKDKEGFSTGSSLASDIQANLQEVFSTPKAFELGTTSEEGNLILVGGSMPPVPNDYVDGVGNDQENVVEKVKGLNEVSDEVHAKLREIKGVHEVSDSGIHIVENLHVEDLMPDGEIQELQPKPSKQLDSRMVDSSTEKQDAPNQFQFPMLRSDDADISVNQQSNLNTSHDQHSATEQPLALESDAGSSILFDGNMEMKNAKLHIPEPSVVDRNDPLQQSSQETVASSTSESTVDNSEAPGNFPKSLNSKDKLGHSDYEANKKQSEADDLLI